MVNKSGKQKLLMLCVLIFVGLILSSFVMAQTSTKPVVLKGVVGKYFSIENLTFQSGADLYKLIGNTAGLEKYIGMQVEITGIVDGSTGIVCPPKGIMAPCRILKNLKVISYRA